MVDVAAKPPTVREALAECVVRMESATLEAIRHYVNSAHVITISDGASHGKRDDKSGPALVGILYANQYEVTGPEIVPDERDRIAAAITKAADGGINFVITTGGTGLGPR